MTAEGTPLDRAHAQMTAAGDADEAARLGFFACLADSELVLLLAREPMDDTFEPELVEHEGITYALVFDSEARAAALLGRPAPYAAMPGRALARLLYGRGIGLGLNLDVAPSSMLLPPEAVDWLAEALEEAEPAPAEARIRAIHPPRDWPERLIAALASALGPAGGLCPRIYLADAETDDGRLSRLVALVGARPDAEEQLARAVAEAVAFSGLGAEPVDVVFLSPSDLVVPTLSEVALRVAHAPGHDHAHEAEPETPRGPGMDPDRPPILR